MGVQLAASAQHRERASPCASLAWGKDAQSVASTGRVLLSHHHEVEPSQIEDRPYFQEPGRFGSGWKQKEAEKEVSAPSLPPTPRGEGTPRGGREKGSGPRNWFNPFFSPSALFLESWQGIMHGQVFVCLFFVVLFYPIPPIIKTRQNRRNNLLLVILGSI